jgi:hypothetical protein
MAQTDLGRAQGLTAPELQAYFPRPTASYAHIIASIVAGEVIKNAVEFRRPTCAENVLMLRLLSRELAETADNVEADDLPKIRR